jgi:hypothetical protein
MGKKQDVRINVRIDSVDPLRFSVEPVSKGLPKDPDGKIKFKNKKGEDGFRIYFDLVDPPEGYLWPDDDDIATAVWSKLGGQCPTEGAWEVFEPLRSDNNCKTLVVDNPNPCPAQGEFHYTLRVVNGAGQYLNLDPGAINQNGGYDMQSASVLTAAVGGVIAGCLLTLAFQALT